MRSSPSQAGSHSEPPTSHEVDRELGRVGDQHHRHYTSLQGVADDEVRDLDDRAGHVRADDYDAGLLDLSHRLCDVAAHQRAGQDEDTGAVQAGYGANRAGQALLADERDRVDRDPLAPDVVAVSL